MRIYFLNDKEILNIRYRSGLMRLFTDKGYRVYNRRSSLIELLQIYFKSNALVVSSNLRTNIRVMILLFWRRKTIIINGLGRAKFSPLFRYFIMLLFSMQNRRTTFIFQNRSDYRLYSKHLVNVHWVPGSGGSIRSIGTDGIVVVSRKEKFILQRPSLLSAFNDLKLEGITIVGIDSSGSFKYHDKIHCVGYVNQENILKYGKTLLYPSGYGDGFPHVLADAIASNMNVIIEYKSYLEFGLDKLGCKYHRMAGNWIKLDIAKEGKEKIEQRNINANYFSLII